MQRMISKLAGIALALMIPAHAIAAGSADEAYAKRVALSKKIKKMKEMRNALPLPPAAGLSGVYAFPEKGQYVMGVNFRNFKFSGLLQGSDSISAPSVATSAPNRFFGAPMQPPTLRVIPKRAEGNVIFPYINYAVSQKLAVVAMAPLIRKETVLETFKGAKGAISLGTNTVSSEGLGDVKLGILVKAYNGKARKHNVIIDAILSAPTGSITETDMSLTPMNTMKKTRLAYGLQLGTGTWDALLGVAYWGKVADWGWGAQYLATLPLESENDEGWRYGDKHTGTAWLSYSWEPTLVTSTRLSHETQDRIEGIDPKIFGAGLGANPDNYGGTKTEFSVGVNWMYKPARNIGLEYSQPIRQDRNGVQPDHTRSIMISWRNAFF